MSIDRERVTLSAGERQRLADLEASLSYEDPDLDATLSHRRRRAPSLSAAAQLIVAAMIVVLGSGLVITTFARWLWIALVGVALQAAGIHMGINSVRRIRSERAAAS